MTTTFDTDPHTQTVAAAWASSPLGQPDHEVGHGFATEPDGDLAPQPQQSRPVGKHAVIAAALACGIGAGAALGLLLFDVGPDQSAVVVPGTAPAPAVVITPNVTAPAPQTVAPNPVSPGGQRGPAEITVPRNTVTAETPPPAAPPTPQQPVDTDEQPQPPEDQQPQPPQDPQPEDPADPQPPQPPEPPVVVDDFTQPEAEPDPEPPVVVPDLPLVLAP